MKKRMTNVGVEFSSGSKLQCVECGQQYKTSAGFAKHTCPKGTCVHCGWVLKDLSKHRCPIQKFNTFNISEFNVDPLLTGKICDACKEWHPMTKNVHGFREWKGIDLCFDCYHVPEVQRDIYALRTEFVHFLVHRGQVDCALCLRALICPVNRTQIRSYELDHCEPRSKSDSVGAMIMKGRPFTQICEESLKCRLLCVRCHARVTYAQRSLGSCNAADEVMSQSVDRVVQKIIVIDENRQFTRV